MKALKQHQVLAYACALLLSIFITGCATSDRSRPDTSESEDVATSFAIALLRDIDRSKAKSLAEPGVLIDLFVKSIEESSLRMTSAHALPCLEEGTPEYEDASIASCYYVDTRGDADPGPELGQPIQGRLWIWLNESIPPRVSRFEHRSHVAKPS